MSDSHENISSPSQVAAQGLHAGRDITIGDISQTFTYKIVNVEASTERERKERRYLRDLLADVELRVNSRLKQSLDEDKEAPLEEKLIPLEKILYPRLVNSPIAKDLVRARPESKEPTNGSIVCIFNGEDASKKLLILGTPGSGKTITLLELAKNLVSSCAKSNLEEPIPILLNISTWKVNNKGIINWIITELKDKYGVNLNDGERWLRERRLALLLDELDRLSVEERKVCIKEINQFLVEFRPKSIAVCSRLEEYKNSDLKLELEGAVCLLPLTKPQIIAYLNKIDKSELVKAIEEESDLLEVAETPLLLSMLVLTFKDPEILVDTKEWKECNSKKARRYYVFENFIQQMLDREIKSIYYANPPTPYKTKYWLVQLAKILKTKSPTDFLIENIQPSWWLTVDEQKIYDLVVRLTVGFVSGLTAGLYLGGWSHELVILLSAILMGTIVGGLSYIVTLILERHYNFYSSVLYKILPGLIFFIMMYGFSRTVSLKGWNFLVLLTGIGVGTVFCGLSSRDIKPADKVEFSSRKAIHYAGFGLLLGFIFIPIHFALQPNLYLEDSLYWLYELISFFLVGLLVGLIPGREVSINLKKTSNQGIWRTRNYALMWFFIGSFIGGTFTVIMDGYEVIRTTGIALTVGLLASLIGSSCSGLVCIQHFILRLTLSIKGYIPWNYSRFLDYTTELKFIQKVSGYYRFWHDPLRKYFAENLDLAKD